MYIIDKNFEPQQTVIFDQNGLAKGGEKMGEKIGEKMGEKSGPSHAGETSREWKFSVCENVDNAR